jgi:hypothetical protein
LTKPDLDQYPIGMSVDRVFPRRFEPGEPGGNLAHPSDSIVRGGVNVSAFLGVLPSLEVAEEEMRTVFARQDEAASTPGVHRREETPASAVDSPTNRVLPSVRPESPSHFPEWGPGSAESSPREKRGGKHRTRGPLFRFWPRR